MLQTGLLATLPLNKHGFVLHKCAFQDALALWYEWPLLCAPTCIELLSQWSKSQRGLALLRYKEITDLVLLIYCTQVCVEPKFMPVNNFDEFSGSCYL